MRKTTLRNQGIYGTIPRLFRHQGIKRIFLSGTSCFDNRMVSVAPICTDTPLLCVGSKPWPHGRRFECRSEGARMGCVGYRVAHCSGRPIEVLLQTPCYHIMWECLHIDSSACRAIYLFAAFFFSRAHLIWRNTGVRAKQSLLSELGRGWGREKVAWSGKQSLTWHQSRRRACNQPRACENKMIGITGRRELYRMFHSRLQWREKTANTEILTRGTKQKGLSAYSRTCMHTAPHLASQPTVRARSGLGQRLGPAPAEGRQTTGGVS